jgi:hypothetical protein
MGEKWTNWHNAVLGAIQLEFLDYLDDLEFTSEYQLTFAPLKIDVLIIKKTRDIVIDKNIGRIFRNANIIEYKSPKDDFTVANFGKAMTYCYGYTSKKEYPITDITLSIIVSMEPKTVFEHIKDVYGWEIEEVSLGLYIVSGVGMAFPIQFIETKKLSTAENLWLKALRDKVPRESLAKVLEESKKLENIDKETLAAYIYVLAGANEKTIEELIKMGNTAFDDLMERTGYKAKWEQRAREQERQQWEQANQQWQSKYTETQRQLEEAQTMKRVGLAILSLVKSFYDDVSLKRIRFILSVDFENNIENLFKLLNAEQIEKLLLPRVG